MANAARAVEDVEAKEHEWMRAHRALSRLARERAAADAEEGRALLAALRAGAHAQLGFGSFPEYVERLFGYRPRTTREKLRVAEALERLPATERALSSGAVSWCAVRELTRVATRDTEAAWLEHADGKTQRQIEALVAARLPGDTPDAPECPEARRHVLRFEVRADTLATFREALDHIRRDGAVLDDDDAALLALARYVLGGPSDSGRASYQIALSVCPECGRGAQRGRGELVPVSPEIVAMACCDGQELAPVGAHAESGGPERREVNVANDDAGRREVNVANDNPGPVGADRDRAAKSTAHVGTARKFERGSALPRAKQTVPPAVRRTVLLRDQHRCRVPGCANATFLDVHHIRPRSEGGSHSPHNLITLCGAHHRAIHRGQLIITGTGANDAAVLHADGTLYGALANAQTTAIVAKVLSALRGLGFREGEAKAVLSELSARSPGAHAAPATPEALLREALLRLTAARA